MCHFMSMCLPVVIFLGSETIQLWRVQYSAVLKVADTKLMKKVRPHETHGHLEILRTMFPRRC